MRGTQGSPIVLLGSPVQHSISPQMQNSALQERELPLVYEKREVDAQDFSAALAHIRTGTILGANVTLPHKRLAARSVDLLSPEANRSGSVNTIERLKDGRLKGHDTDGMGFLESLKEEGAFAPQSSSLVMYGAGGAACAVARSLRDSGYPAPHFHVRDTQRVQKALEPEFPGAQFLSMENAPKASQGETLHVHCTPIGLGANQGSTLWDDAFAKMEDWLPTNMTSCVAVDLIYTPEETPFIQVARSRGATTVSGLGMLVHQGALAFEIWTQHKAPVQVMWAAARKALNAP